MTESGRSESLLVDVQQVLSEQEGAESEEPPSAGALTNWARSAYEEVRSEPSEVTIRITDAAEIEQLNRSYRNKDTATNVLSFPVEMEFNYSANDVESLNLSSESTVDSLPIRLLGDIVICHSVVVTEASVQGKSVSDHYAHMVTHGILHLCGYDHQDDSSAQVMESLETKILAANGVANPY